MNWAPNLDRVIPAWTLGIVAAVLIVVLSGASLLEVYLVGFGLLTAGLFTILLWDRRESGIPIVLSFLLSVVVGFLWPAILAAMVGVLVAYPVETETA